MTTVTIIGAGELGGAVARALATGDTVKRILIVDTGSVAAGKALDIRQAGAIDYFHTELAGTDDLTRAAGSEVCVLADRSGAGEWAGEDGLALLKRLEPLLSGAPLVFAGCEQHMLIAAASRELGLRRERLVGSAPEALVSAVKAIVALEARCSPDEVTLTVLGRPAAGFVVPWSEASIGGYALQRVFEQARLARIEARVAKLWPPGPYALGAAAARVTAAIVASSRASLAVLTSIEGEFGVRRAVGILPAVLSRRGIVHVRVPELNTRERIMVETALSR